MSDDEAPGEADVDERIRGLAQNNAETARNKKAPDKTYQKEWRNFRAYIDNERNENRLPAGPKYLSRQNVDLYFTEVVAERYCVPDTARRVVPALQWYSTYEEHIHEPFVVDSATVRMALQSQKGRRSAKEREKTYDPHANLPTDVLSPNDYTKLHNVVVNQPNWADLQLCMSICDATFIRNGSFRKLMFQDLKLDTSHGPIKEDSGPGKGRMMTEVLRPGDVHKDRHKYTTVVGHWRHSEYIRCATGALAMNFFVRFRNDAALQNINFYAAPGAPVADPATGERPRPAWWSIHLVWKWTNYASANTAYKSALRAADIEWAKVTHMRKSGMDKGSTEGVGQGALNSMSKHSTKENKSSNRYYSQIDGSVCKVMAGFSKTEPYFVPRILLVPPWTEEQMTEACFPRIQQWRAQQAAPDGDKTRLAKDFLYDTLPFLALTAFQDGIYWIRDFPNHEVSIMLRNLFPTYENWALEARRWVDEKQNTLEESKVALLEGASQAAFNVLTRQIEQLHAGISTEIKQAVAQTEQKFEQSMRQVFMLPQGGSQWNVSQNAYTSFSFVPPQSSRLPLPAPPTHVVPLGGPPQIQQNNDALAALRGSPRMPEIPKELPLSIFEVLKQHQQRKLDTFKNSTKQHWPDPLRLAFSKRKYLYEQICKRAALFSGSDAERMDKAARRMDEERGVSSVNSYLEQLKQNDSTVKRRAPKKPRTSQN